MKHSTHRARLKDEGDLVANVTRLAAITGRDRRADGQFFYAVRTTGIYCRPSCPSRLPRKENVAFFTSCAAAEQAGFRACKRCQPNGMSLEKEQAEKIAAACLALDSTDDPLSLAALAREAGMSKFHFHRVFVRVTGLTPKAYAAANRVERVRKELKRHSDVTTAIYEAGYGSSGRFYADTSGALGMKPRRFQKGGEGVAIRFAVGKCSLGSVLAASTEKGVCAILMGDDPKALVRELEGRFPKARLIANDRKYAGVLATVIGLVESPRRGLDLPLDIQGTVFQRRVWLVLRKIPAGETLSYTELARRAGAPRAVRAVAGACAANAIAVVIPCHRIVRNNGDISGYRWGVERKRELLRREKTP